MLKIEYVTLNVVKVPVLGDLALSSQIDIMAELSTKATTRVNQMDYMHLEVIFRGKVIGRQAMVPLLKCFCSSGAACAKSFGTGDGVGAREAFWSCIRGENEPNTWDFSGWGLGGHWPPWNR